MLLHRCDLLDTEAWKRLDQRHRRRGGIHFPTSASCLGAYMRMVRLKRAFGAGSQFASLSAPGFSFWL
jgi:hypothetical protein